MFEVEFDRFDLLVGLACYDAQAPSLSSCDLDNHSGWLHQPIDAARQMTLQAAQRRQPAPLLDPLAGHERPRRRMVAGLHQALGPLIEKVSRAMVKALELERVYVCSFGEVVKHVHLFFVPRYPNMPPSGPSILVQMGSGDSPWACDDETAANPASRVRSELLKES